MTAEEFNEKDKMFHHSDTHVFRFAEAYAEHEIKEKDETINKMFRKITEKVRENKQLRSALELL